jgi:hypothetical protein
MATINVQFQDSTNKVITSYFPNEQDPSVFQNQGEVDTSDMRWKTYYDGIPPSDRVDLPSPDAA